MHSARNWRARDSSASIFQALAAAAMQTAMALHASAIQSHISAQLPKASSAFRQTMDRETDHQRQAVRAHPLRAPRDGGVDSALSEALGEDSSKRLRRPC